MSCGIQFARLFRAGFKVVELGEVVVFHAQPYGVGTWKRCSLGISLIAFKVRDHCYVVDEEQR